MRLKIALLATISLTCVSAFAQEQITDPSVPKTSGFYSKFASGSLSYSTGGCSSYGYACSYSTDSVVPSTFEASQYVASLPVGDYICEIYYGTKQPTVTTSNGRVTTYFAPALFCQTPPPKPALVIPAFPAVPGLCIGEAADGFDQDSIVTLNHFRYENGKKVLAGVKARFVNLDAEVPASDIVPDVKVCSAAQRAYLIDTVRWVSSEDAPQGYVAVELTQKDYPYLNTIVGLLKLDQSSSLNRLIEESRVNGGKKILLP